MSQLSSLLLLLTLLQAAKQNIHRVNIKQYMKWEITQKFGEQACVHPHVVCFRVDQKLNWWEEKNGSDGQMGVVAIYIVME